MPHHCQSSRSYGRRFTGIWFFENIFAIPVYNPLNDKGLDGNARSDLPIRISEFEQGHLRCPESRGGIINRSPQVVCIAMERTLNAKHPCRIDYLLHSALFKRTVS